MAKYANKVVEQAKAWLGYNESDGTHKEIIDVYNSHKPLARGYKVKYTDAWCATFVSAVAIKLGYTDIIPTECSCPKMIDLFKKIGSFDENDARTPNPGDVLFYDWEDNGAGDNKGNPNHVGIVEKVSNGEITVIEGNYSDSVKRRTLAVNGKYIRGYGVPTYDTEKTTKPTTTAAKPKKVNAKVKEFQVAAIADGLGKYLPSGADGIWGKECETVAKKNLCYKRAIGYKYKNLTKVVQKGVGLSGKNVDGKFGSTTKTYVKNYQKKHRLGVDGVVGINTWKKLLGV